MSQNYFYNNNDKFCNFINFVWLAGPDESDKSNHEVLNQFHNQHW